MLKKRERINFLWDFYGDLLTKRQLQIVELYYKHDLSLGEISEELNISRQAAHDVLKRSIQTLEELESKLLLYEKFINQQQELKYILKLLNQVKTKQIEEKEILEVINRVKSFMKP